MSPFVAPPPGLTVKINSRPADLLGFKVNQHVEHVTSRSPRPDPYWEMIDTQGHYHAYSGPNGLDQKPTKYPTLTHTSDRMPCDGSCGGICEGEGYTVVRYTCIICGESIEPGLITRPYTVPIAMLYEWKLDVVTEWWPPGHRVSVHLSDGRFGIAEVFDRTAKPNEPVITELIGASPLGMREPESEHVDEPG